MTRRELLAWGALPAAASGQQPYVRHILPAANDNSFLIKVSFHQPLKSAPVLRVGKRRVGGLRTDTDSQFWMFHAEHLTPGLTYQLQVTDSAGKPLSEPWPLRTFPPPDATVDRFRLLIYTCAGGHDAMRIPDSTEPYWVSLTQRRKLLQNALRQPASATFT